MTPTGVIRLRDGTGTLDPRMDRLVHFDEASRAHPIRAGLERKTFRSMTWAPGPTLDQGTDGACVGFGVTGELAARPVPVPQLDARFAKERIYWPAQRIDPWEGGSYPGAEPRYEGTSVLAGAKVAQAAGYIDEYRWAFGLDEVLMGLAWAGPVVFGFNWRRAMYAPAFDGRLIASGDVVGGHCVLGWRVVNPPRPTFSRMARQVWIANSWGEGWGVGGAAYLSLDDLGRLLDDDGEACFFIRRHLTPRPAA